VDSDNGNDSNVYIHFQKPDPAKPLRVVWVEGKDFQVYEMTTMRIGNRDIFASRTLISDEKEEMPKGYFLGFYEVKGNEASFWLLDAEKIGTLIAANKVRGVKGTGKYDMAQLTGSPAELSRFLASADAQAAAVTPPARLRRLPETRQ
jgi:hypothetical protein